MQYYLWGQLDLMVTKKLAYVPVLVLNGIFNQSMADNGGALFGDAICNFCHCLLSMDSLLG